MKTWVENSKESLGKDPEKDKLEYSCWEKNQKEILLSVDRPVDQQWSNFWPLGIAVDRSVNHFPNQRAKLSVGRQGRSLRPNREQSSCSRSTARSIEVHIMHLVHVNDRSVDQQSNSALFTVDRLVDRLKAKSKFWRSFWNQSFSTKMNFVLNTQ